MLEPKKWKQHTSSSCLNLTSFLQLPTEKNSSLINSILSDQEIKILKLKVSFRLSGKLKIRLRAGESIQKQHILVSTFVCQCCYVIWKDCEALMGIRKTNKQKNQTQWARKRGEKQVFFQTIYCQESFHLKNTYDRQKKRTAVPWQNLTVLQESNTLFMVLMTRRTLDYRNNIKPKVIYKHQFVCTGSW